MSNKIHIGYDLYGILVCEKYDIIDSEYSFIIKKISGCKKKDVLSSNVNEIDLNLLLNENFRNIHNKFILDILLNGKTSIFWEKFVRGKMTRNIEIKNPINHKIFNTNLTINLLNDKKNISSSKYEFEIIFNNIQLSEKNNLAKTCVLTHELSSIIKSSSSIIDKYEKDNDKLYIYFLKDLMNEANNIINETRKSICDNFNLVLKKKDKYCNIDNILILVFLQIISKLKNSISNVKIMYNLENINLVLNDDIDIQNDLEKIIVFFNKPDLIKKHNLKININFYGQGTNIFINVEFNFEMKINNYLNKIVKVFDVIESNSEFINFNINDNRICVRFIFMEKHFKKFDTDIVSNLKKKQIDTILNLKIKINSEKKIILLIDDSLVNLKLLLNNFIKINHNEYNFKNFPKLTMHEWQELGMITLDTDNFTYILAANGLYGKEISILTNPHLIITDIQMPKLNGLDMICELSVIKLSSKIFAISAYLSEIDEEMITFLKDNDIKYVEKNGNFDWINDALLSLS